MYTAKFENEPGANILPPALHLKQKRHLSPFQLLNIIAIRCNVM